MKHPYYYAAAAVAALLLSACSSNPKTEELAAAPPPQATPAPGLDSRAVDAQRRAEARALAVAKLRDQRLVYFEFDESGISTEYRDLIAQHAKFLADNPDIRVRLEGHADERGTREYNMGLGERRAIAVRQALMLQGITSQQLDTTSYGEELPAVADASTKRSYALNRRVELHYLNGELANAPLSHQKASRQAGDAQSQARLSPRDS